MTPVERFKQLKDKPLSRAILRYANIIFALALLGLVLNEVGINELVNVFSKANLALIAFCIALTPTGIFLSAYKWQLLLKAQNISCSLLYLSQLLFMGIFFNNFLPSSVGGDVVRIAELGKTIRDPATAAASVFIDRLTGFVVLIVLACLVFAMRFYSVDSLPLSLFVLLALGGIATIAWLAFDMRLLAWVQRHIHLSPLQNVIAKLVKFQTALSHYKNQPRVIVASLLLSVLFYIRAAIVIYVAALAFIPSAPFIDVALTVPITMTVATMPFAINGIGLQEWSYVLLFPMIKLPASVGLSTILVVRLATLVTVVFGGLIYLRMRVKRNEQSLNLSLVQSSDI